MRLLQHPIFFALCFLKVFPGMPMSQAQTFALLESNPADGDSSVALEATVRFSFSAAIDTTQRYSSGWPVAFFAIEPADSLVIDSLYYNDDLTELRFDVHHTANTDFIWLVTGALSQDATFLCQPFSLNYTTAAEYGDFSVSGSIVTIVPVSAKTACEHDFFHQAKPFAVLMDGDPRGETGVVRSVLTDLYDGSFSIRGVRPGTYWPVALIDANFDGEIEPNWGLYPSIFGEATILDGDFRLGTEADGIPDSIAVQDSSFNDLFLTFSGPGSRETGARVPDFLDLGRPYPNPAHGAVTLPLHLAANPGYALRVDVYDAIGRRVAALPDQRLAPGSHEVRWDRLETAPERLPSGLYIFHVTIGPYRQTRTVIFH
jgi:hypothetical protein